MTALVDLQRGHDAELTGTVEVPGIGLVDPITGDRCAIVEVVLVLEIMDLKKGPQVDLVREYRAGSFFLRVGTERVRVDVGDTLPPRFHRRIRTGRIEAAPDCLVEFLTTRERWIAEPSRYVVRTHYRVQTLAAEEVATVGGRVSIEPDPDPTAQRAGYRDQAMRFVLEAPAGSSLLIRA